MEAFFGIFYDLVNVWDGQDAMASRTSKKVVFSICLFHTVLCMAEPLFLLEGNVMERSSSFCFSRGAASFCFSRGAACEPILHLNNLSMRCVESC